MTEIKIRAIIIQKQPLVKSFPNISKANAKIANKALPAKQTRQIRNMPTKIANIVIY